MRVDDDRKSSLVVSALIGIPMVAVVKLRMVYANNCCIDWRHMTLRPQIYLGSINDQRYVQYRLAL